jgi:hypothetical protein
MLIKVTNLETGQYIKTIDYDGLVEICAGDKDMANDFVRWMIKHPDNQKVKERWEIIEY